MGVILEFTIPADGFALGRALGGQSDIRIELERIIPVEGSPVPFFWVEGGVHDALEADVQASTYIENLTRLVSLGDHSLYRVEWTGEREDLLEGIRRHGATILESHSNDTWTFRLRFLDHQQLGEFYNYCTDHELPIQIERVYTLTEETLQGRIFDLTTEQREALLLALDRGYFATPRETTMQDIATDLDITQQALSDRIRRGVEKILQNTLQI